MKNLFKYIVFVILMMILSSLITYYLTKKKYENEFIPKPIISTINQLSHIKPIEGRGVVSVEKIPKRENRDSTQIKPTDSIMVTTASMDTAVQYESKITIKDTTIVSNDTLYLKIKYYFPPENKFIITPIIKNKNYIYTEFKPVYVEKSKTIFDKIGIVIGIGYGTHFDKIQIAPTIFMGIAYKIEIKF